MAAVQVDHQADDALLFGDEVYHLARQSSEVPGRRSIPRYGNFPKENESQKDGDDDAEFVDGSDSGHVTELDGLEIEQPGDTGRDT